jgi:asparagine synthase (glutamine-hydrolysing)
MCGIAGIVDINPGSISLDRLKNMTDIIAHRGPDGDGLWISPSNQVALGHRRLSIIDLSNSGKQPMSYLSRYTITFNGEIYNYIEIRESLIKRGYKFHSSSDTEVLLALYDAEKEGCLTFLDGMFSFAIWDEKENTLFFARDRFGEKPFHYAYKKGAYFVFGSEMKELWAYGIKKVVNYGMLYRYLTNNELLNQQNLAETFYEGIFRLEAAHYGKLHLPDLNLKIIRYWDLNIQQPDTAISAIAAQDKFRELFTTSVQRRLRSDVPVGSSLSGGLDSSLVVCVIDELNKGQEIKQNTFSARFPGFKKDEGNFMQMVIDKTNVSPHFTFPNDNDLISNLEKLIWHQEEPFGSASIFVQYEVMKLAKENNVTVLLDGQGADEVMAGYHTYYYPYFRELRKKNKQAYSQQLGYYQQLQESGPMNAVQYKPGLKSWMREILPDNIIRKLKEQQLKRANYKAPFLNKDLFNAHFKNNTYSQQIVFDSLNHALYESTTGSGLQELLRYADRNSMAHSREVRLPFLSHELVEFLFTLPANFKINNGWTKFIMRKTFDNVLPTEIAWRKDKIGYEPPQKNWMENKHLQEMIRSYENVLVQEKILDANSGLNKNGHFADRNWQILMSGSLL